MLTWLLTPFFSSAPFDICFPGRSGDFWPERLENVTRNFLQSQLRFLSAPTRGGSLVIVTWPRGRSARQANGLARALAAPPLGSAARGLGAPPRGGGEKVSFAGEERPWRADAAHTATLPQLAVLFGFPLASPGHERALLPGLKERGLPGSVRGGRAHTAPSAGVHSRLEVGAGSRARAGAEPGSQRETAGPRWARRGSAHPRRLWDCCCARCWDARARPRAAAAGPWGRLLGSAQSTGAPFRAAASGTSWTAVASGCRVCPSRSRPGSLGCKYSS